jgi:hypothetical protein
MPPFLVPRHVSAHRTSAIALYRALLQQSRAVPLPAESKAELQNIVRNRCKQTIHLHSYQRLRLAFQAGYEAIEHLDASVAGDEKSTSYIAELISKAPAKVKADPPRAVLAKGRRKKSKDEGSEDVVAPPTPAFKPSTELLSRPVLRIKKPQPPNLSGFIRHRIDQRQRRHDRRHWLEEQVEFAQYEDLWDEILEEQIGVDAGVETRREMLMEPTWAEEFQIAKDEVEFKIKEELRKNGAMAVRMQEVVDLEREAFERERAARKEAKRLAKTGKERHVKAEGHMKEGRQVMEAHVEEELEKENIFRVIRS